MRLSKVKLSGFKSFVDTTTFELTGRLNGIVGPNGCGKSNIIDAVRWVMGESSAKQLRGESMSDVIFNGSTHRKPSGFASIELIFDNRQGMLGGKWAAYNEISVRRLLDREGKSQYFLNGVRCRRRDITDIFMGTGLGPRSYAIIEQGMISRIVESKPEELRVFFEEAANISKYKEKRRETELRISHTRENLDRLTDIRTELGQQLSRLEKQAKVAERYKQLKLEERALDYWRMKSQRKGLTDQLAVLHQSQEVESSNFQQTVEKFNEATIRLIDEKKQLEQQESAQKKTNTAYYEYKQQMDTLKHELTMLQELKFRDSKSLEEWNDRALTLTHEITTHTQLLEETNIEIDTLETEMVINEESLTELNERIEHSTKKYSALVDQNSVYSSELNSLKQKITIDENRLQYEQDKTLNLQRQHERLTAESGSLPDHEESSMKQQMLEEELIVHQENSFGLEDKKEQLATRLATLNESLHSLVKEKNTLGQERSELQGKVNALTALKIVNKERKNVTNPLYQTLTITDGWNKAFDHVLAKWLTISTDDHIDSSYYHGNIAFTFTPQHLGYYAKTALSLGSILSHVYIATDESNIDAMRAKLELHEWLVTKSGDLYGRDWFIAFAEGDENDGLLEREGEIEAAKIKIKTIEESLYVVEDEYAEQESEKENLITEVATNNESLRVLKESIHEKEKALSLLQQETQHRHREQARITEEVTAITAQLKTNQEIVQELHEKIAEQAVLLEEKKIAYTLFQDSLTEAEQLYSQEKNELETKRFAFMEVKRQFDKLANNKRSYEHTIKRAEEELKTIQDRVAEKNIKTDYDEKIEEKTVSLSVTEDAFRTKEDELSELTVSVTNLREQLESLEAARHKWEKTIQVHKDKLQEMALKEAGLKTQADMMEQTWAELHDNLTEVEIKEFVEEYRDLSVANLKQKMSTVREQLSKIGAVNLVAIEESKTLAERKKYLDEQDEDLNNALTTLENAIKQIDKETRERFMDTFNQVNEDFSTLFPQLFGGGKAYLELTENDALTSGVNIIAHPPGKKPGTIHLLSGGEKALTAMSLVFSIFNLNPAPFCMLDEVDAPLDEANVRRLGELLNTMSEKVQFIFITHNKATMTISDSLIGVTMGEPGVSRIVSVNLEEALEYSDVG